MITKESERYIISIDGYFGYITARPPQVGDIITPINPFREVSHRLTAVWSKAEYRGECIGVFGTRWEDIPKQEPTLEILGAGEKKIDRRVIKY